MKDLTTLSLGACIDSLYKVRAKRLEQQHKVEELAKEEERVREHLLTVLNEGKMEGAKGRLATAAISRTTIPIVKDWDAFVAYVRKNNAFDLIERRPAKLAFRERLEAKQSVPGLEPFVVVSISLTKSSKKEE
jgi:hypothetical protein